MAPSGITSRLARLAPRIAPGTTSKVDAAFTRALDWAVDDSWDDAVARAASAQGAGLDQRVEAVWKAFGRELAAVGAATGGVAAVPTIGTVGSLSAAAAEFGWFTKRAAELILTIAALHGRESESLEERRAWVLAVLLYGNKASREFRKLAAEAGAPGVDGGAMSLPTSVLGRINGSLGRKAITRYATRRAAIAAGQAVPFGIGAAIGGTANYWATRRLARQADKFFRSLR